MLIQKKCLGTVAFIAVDSNPVPFTRSISQLIAFNDEFICDPGEWIFNDCATKSGQGMQRNMIARRMLGDWLFFVDCDHDFSPDLLYRLLMVFTGRNPTGQPLDVLGGYYPFKEHPHPPMAWIWLEDKQQYGQVIRSTTEHVCECGMMTKDETNLAKHQAVCQVRKPGMQHPPLTQVGVVGAGCMLISRRAIQTVLALNEGEPFDPHGIYLYDDFAFCNRARKAGVQVWWAPTIQCPHLMSKAVGASDYDLDFVMSAQSQAQADAAV